MVISVPATVLAVHIVTAGLEAKCRLAAVVVDSDDRVDETSVNRKSDKSTGRPGKLPRVKGLGMDRCWFRTKDGLLLSSIRIRPGVRTDCHHFSAGR